MRLIILVMLILFISTICIANELPPMTTCWKSTGEMVYQDKVKDLYYSLDIPGIVWIHDFKNHDIFVQNLECLIFISSKNKK